jgi:hypothetical protein
MRNAKLFPLILIAVAGCAAQPAKTPDKATTAANDVQCHSEMTTGSMFSKTVCTTKAQRDAQQAVAGDLQRSSAQGGGCRGTGSACQ